MSIVQMLFSFEGRMRRRDFWLCLICLAVLHGLLFSLVAAMFFPIWMTTSSYDGRGTVWPAWWALMVAPPMLAAHFLLLWPRIAVGVKRCHDRDKSGLWLLLLLIPFFGWLWALIDLGLLDGTPGPNQYGPSPKGVGDAAPAPA
jgi:uncharacterized membrane protein YhaH (DUF805 family)